MCAWRPGGCWQAVEDMRTMLSGNPMTAAECCRMGGTSMWVSWVSEAKFMRMESA
jgi:hypothetical protein